MAAARAPPAAAKKRRRLVVLDMGTSTIVLVIVGVVPGIPSICRLTPTVCGRHVPQAVIVPTLEGFPPERKKKPARSGESRDGA
jgi:hypothetical protein